jgi:ABC-type dipeptide/oligopeptide/nickel transport system permease subunit
MWKKLSKNKLGVFGLAFILFTVVLAILGYAITPDSTTDANTIQLQVALQKPGFKTRYFSQEKEQPTTNFFTRVLNGEQKVSTSIPISDYKYPDSIAVFNKNGLVLWEKVETSAKTKEEWEAQHITTKRFWLGTDRYGRDVLSRVIIGARVSLLVGFMAVIITLLIGTTLGLLAGYFGGWVDAIILWFINVVWSLPSLLIAIAISFAFSEKGLYQVFLAIGLSMWVELARIVRGQVKQIREMEYIQAAKVLGFKSIRILFGHILPNVTAPIIVVCAANFASAILLEAGLSFLGLGVQPPTPSWGTMIKEHYNYIVFDAAYLAIIPGVCIMLLVMSFNFLGNALRDALDVNLN